MTSKEIMAELRSKGSENIKKILLKHGVREPLFGVKVEHLKEIQKKIKIDYQLAKDLYETGNADAMYLAGLIADDRKMTKADMHRWVQQALSLNISEYTVPWVAAEGMFGYELALVWIDSPEEYIAAAGWNTLASLVALKDDADLNIAGLKTLLSRVVKDIHTAKNRVRHTMNGFVIAVGTSVVELTSEAMAVAIKIGPVRTEGDGKTSILSSATENILKRKEKGTIGKKKKTVKC
jgi:3-methyladenine DNA glycosylase AlkD